MNPVGLGIALVGLLWVLGFGYAYYRAVGKAKASEGWPTASGKILGCRVAVEESSDNDGNSTTWYNPVVSYAYAAAGRDLEGSRIRFGNIRSTSRKNAEAALAPYPAEAAVTVRYNPDKPEECVLETRKPGPMYLIVSLVGLLFVGLGLWLAVSAR